MPSIAEVSPNGGGTGNGMVKRKREGLSEMEENWAGNQQQYHPHSPSNYLPYSTIHRHDHLNQQHFQQQRTLLKPRSMKRQRMFRASQEAVLPHQDNQIQSRPRLQHTSAMDLNPCHICHRKPSVRTDLDSYAYCESCGKRTCYICIRECAGPEDDEERILGVSFTDEDYGMVDMLDLGEKGEEISQHSGMVCSRCCAERGVDGEVRCLGCLAKDVAVARGGGG